tara:strand:+ start:23049 stop:23651 length:603 start_codon:yes stop_codon:yes gene_type:complete
MRKIQFMSKRCDWANPKNPIYLEYHDKEWGRPLFDDLELFEMLCLEGAQAGLSWETILNKRQNYRKAFDDFDPKKMARYASAKTKSLMNDEGIVRNRLKIAAFITNAQAYLALEKEGESFSHFVWSFVEHKPIINKVKDMKSIPVQVEASVLMSKALKKKGFKFVGPTICYAFMQAVGMVNDHLETCKYSGKRLKRKGTS